MALSEVLICNMALAKIGHTLPIPIGTGLISGASSTEINLSKAIVQCQLWYELVRDTIGRDFAYGTTTKYALLTLANNGDGQVWEDVWENAWTYPGDCLWLRGFIVAPAGWVSWPQGAWPNSIPAMQRISPTWTIGQLSGARVIFANGVDEDNPLVEYTIKQTDATDNDLDVADAHAWRLAAELCLPLLGAESGARMREFCERGYAMALDKAKRAAANESAPYETGDGRWMTVRGS